jgi:hypothetical protein
MRDYIQQPLEVLSYGGGVQSTAMLHMIAEGKLPMPDLVVFSDTGSERAETTDHIRNHTIPFCEEHGIRFQIVTSHLGRLDDDYRERGAIPLIGTRHCTAKFKIRPIRRFLRTIVGGGAGKVLVHVWLGITTDEAQREGESDVKWAKNVYPLLRAGISREDCIQFNKERSINVVKSGCFMCPYQNGKEWLEVRENHPDLWDRSLTLEDAYFKKHPHRWKGLRYDKKKLRDDLEGFAGTKCDGPGGCFT